MDQRFIGKSVLVTGASAGIGEAIAVRLAQEGASVGINYSRNDAGAANTARQVQEAHSEGGFDGARILTHKADVSDESSVKAMFEAVLSEWGRLDVMINNAGIQKAAPSEDSLTARL